MYRRWAFHNSIPTQAHNKITKHLLTAALYPQIHRLLTGFFPITDSPLVCAALGGATILIFGLWLGTKIRWKPTLFPIILLLGLSFTTWYVSSVWEARAFMLFGSILLLVSLDNYIRRPTKFSLFLCVIATCLSLLISIGRLYLLALMPLAFLLRAGRTGWATAIKRILLGAAAVITIVALSYEIFGLTVNPSTRLANVVEVSQQQQRHIGADFSRLNRKNYRNVSLQALVYGVGGLYLPCGSRTRDREWANQWAYLAYLYHWPGTIFVVGYAITLLTVLLAASWKGLWWREPLLPVIILWIFLYISFFAYYNPWAGSVYAAELLPPFWALAGIALGRLRPRPLLLGLLLLLAAAVAVNNLSVINYFKYYYGTPKEQAEIAESGRIPKEPVFRAAGALNYTSRPLVRREGLLTPFVHHSRGYYNLWLWGIIPEKQPGGRIRVEAAHAAPGLPGGFRLAAFADTDGDGRPDREIARSEFFEAESAGDWSSFEFSAPEGQRIFVGLTWPEDRDTAVFRGIGDWPIADSPLENQYYQRRKPRAPPTGGRAYTNLRVEFP